MLKREILETYYDNGEKTPDIIQSAGKCIKG